VSFWEANRKLLVGIGAVLVVGMIFHFAVVAALWSDGNTSRAEGDGLLEKIENRASKPVEAGEAFARLKQQRLQIEKVLGGLGGGLLQIARNSPYRVPSIRRNDARFYFEERLNILRKERTEGRAYPAKCPLGFTKEVQSKDPPEVLLERLAAVDRLTGAAHSAGLQRVASIRHGPLKVRSSSKVTDVHLVLLPMQLTATADERGLVQFCTQISREDAFLALDSLDVKVANPEAKTLTMTVGVSALLLRRKPAPSTRNTGPRVLPLRRY
jgi:hypothetical protein